MSAPAEKGMLIALVDRLATSIVAAVVAVVIIFFLKSGARLRSGKSSA